MCVCVCVCVGVGVCVGVCVCVFPTYTDVSPALHFVIQIQNFIQINLDVILKFKEFLGLVVRRHHIRRSDTVLNDTEQTGILGSIYCSAEFHSSECCSAVCRSAGCWALVCKAIGGVTSPGTYKA